MEKRILEYLKEVEKENNIEILFAVESGSRAWGFASPDSDYDIRFVYKHNKEWYLKLWEQKDTIEFMTEDDLDGSGWDIRKALQLLAKSNASFLGWLFSPIVYRADEKFLKEIKTLAIENFNPVASFYHYHSMSKNFETELNTTEVNLKSFFYAIRTTLCAKWIRENKTIAPVIFKELYTLLDENYQKKLDALIDLKSKSIEKSTIRIDKELIDLVKSNAKENKELKDSLINKKSRPEDFNKLFVKAIG